MNVKKILISIGVGLVAVTLRNFSFQYHDTIIYLFSILIGLGLGLLCRKDLHIGLGAIILFWLFPLLPVGIDIFRTDYIVSALPLSLMAALVYYKKWWWTAGFPILYLPVVWLCIFHSFEKDFKIDEDFNFNLRDMRIYSLEDGKKLEFQKDQIYMISYWHKGCGYCIRQEEVLQNFKENFSSDLPLKIISMESQNKDAEELRTYIDRYHPYFPVYQDHQQLLQKELNLYAGPLLLIADKDLNIKHIYKGFSRDLYWYGAVYWRYKIGELM